MSKFQEYVERSRRARDEDERLVWKSRALQELRGAAETEEELGVVDDLEQEIFEKIRSRKNSDKTPTLPGDNPVRKALDKYVMPAATFVADIPEHLQYKSIDKPAPGESAVENAFGNAAKIAGRVAHGLVLGPGEAAYGATKRLQELLGGSLIGDRSDTEYLADQGVKLERESTLSKAAPFLEAALIPASMVGGGMVGGAVARRVGSAAEAKMLAALGQGVPTAKVAADAALHGLKSGAAAGNIAGGLATFAGFSSPAVATLAGEAQVTGPRGAAELLVREMPEQVFLAALVGAHGKQGYELFKKTQDAFVEASRRSSVFGGSPSAAPQQAPAPVTPTAVPAPVAPVAPPQRSLSRPLPEGNPIGLDIGLHLTQYVKSLPLPVQRVGPRLSTKNIQQSNQVRRHFDLLQKEYSRLMEAITGEDPASAMERAGLNKEFNDAYEKLLKTPPAQTPAKPTAKAPTASPVAAPAQKQATPTTPTVAPPQALPSPAAPPKAPATPPAPQANVAPSSQPAAPQTPVAPVSGGSGLGGLFARAALQVKGLDLSKVADQALQDMYISLREQGPAVDFGKLREVQAEIARRAGPVAQQPLPAVQASPPAQETSPVVEASVEVPRPVAEPPVEVSKRSPSTTKITEWPDDLLASQYELASKGLRFRPAARKKIIAEFERRKALQAPIEEVLAAPEKEAVLSVSEPPTDQAAGARAQMEGKPRVNEPTPVPEAPAGQPDQASKLREMAAQAKTLKAEMDRVAAQLKVEEADLAAKKVELAKRQAEEAAVPADLHEQYSDIFNILDPEGVLSKEERVKLLVEENPVLLDKSVSDPTVSFESIEEAVSKRDAASKRENVVVLDEPRPLKIEPVVEPKKAARPEKKTAASSPTFLRKTKLANLLKQQEETAALEEEIGVEHKARVTAEVLAKKERLEKARQARAEKNRLDEIAGKKKRPIGRPSLQEGERARARNSKLGNEIVEKINSTDTEVRAEGQKQLEDARQILEALRVRTDLNPAENARFKRYQNAVAFADDQAVKVIELGMSKPSSEKLALLAQELREKGYTPEMLKRVDPKAIGRDGTIEVVSYEHGLRVQEQGGRPSLKDAELLEERLNSFLPKKMSAADRVKAEAKNAEAVAKWMDRLSSLDERLKSFGKDIVGNEEGAVNIGTVLDLAAKAVTSPIWIARKLFSKAKVNQPANLANPSRQLDFDSFMRAELGGKRSEWMLEGTGTGDTYNASQSHLVREGMAELLAPEGKYKGLYHSMWKAPLQEGAPTSVGGKIFDMMGLKHKGPDAWTGFKKGSNVALVATNARTRAHQIKVGISERVRDGVDLTLSEQKSLSRILLKKATDADIDWFEKSPEARKLASRMISLFRNVQEASKDPTSGITGKLEKVDYVPHIQDPAKMFSFDEILKTFDEARLRGSGMTAETRTSFLQFKRTGKATDIPSVYDILDLYAGAVAKEQVWDPFTRKMERFSNLKDVDGKPLLPEKMRNHLNDYVQKSVLGTPSYLDQIAADTPVIREGMALLGDGLQRFLKMDFDPGRPLTSIIHAINAGVSMGVVSPLTSGVSHGLTDLARNFIQARTGIDSAKVPLDYARGIISRVGGTLGLNEADMKLAKDYGIISDILSDRHAAATEGLDMTKGVAKAGRLQTYPITILDDGSKLMMFKHAIDFFEKKGLSRETATELAAYQTLMYNNYGGRMHLPPGMAGPAGAAVGLFQKPIWRTLNDLQRYVQEGDPFKTSKMIGVAGAIYLANKAFDVDLFKRLHTSLHAGAAGLQTAYDLFKEIVFPSKNERGETDPLLNRLVGYSHIGREIVRNESKTNSWKRRFGIERDESSDVLGDVVNSAMKTGRFSNILSKFRNRKAAAEARDKRGWMLRRMRERRAQGLSMTGGTR